MISSFTTPLIVTVVSLKALLGLTVSSDKMSLAWRFWAAILLSFAKQSCEKLRGERGEENKDKLVV
jgi:hypothetical protein